MFEERVKPMSSPSSSDNLEEIEELGIKEQHFLATSTLPHVFMDY